MRRAAVVAVLTLIAFSFGPACGDDECSKYLDKVATAATVYEYAGYDSITAISLAKNDVPNPNGCLS